MNKNAERMLEKARRLGVTVQSISEKELTILQNLGIPVRLTQRTERPSVFARYKYNKLPKPSKFIPFQLPKEMGIKVEVCQQPHVKDEKDDIIYENL